MNKSNKYSPEVKERAVRMVQEHRSDLTSPPRPSPRATVAYPGTLAADSSVEQEWDGTGISAAIWCPEEASHMKLREFKHSYTTGERVLTLLLLESAEPQSWDRSWQDGESFDSFDQFVSNGNCRFADWLELRP